MASRVLKKLTGRSPKPVDRHQEPEKEVLREHITPIHKELTEAGQFSYAALCATVLHTLFDSHDKKFKEEVLSLILVAIEQPAQVCETAWVLLQGEGRDEVDPYVDILLIEGALKEGAEAIIAQLMAVGFGQGSYDARMRVFIKRIACLLKVDYDALIDLETTMAETLALSQYQMSEEEKIEKTKKAKRRKYKRYALIALATIGGGTLIGLTGGLAAPLIAVGAGAIIGGAGAAVLGSTAGVAIIGSLFGVAGAGLTGYKMKKRVGSVDEFRFEPLVSGNGLRADALTKQLHITIAVTGWLSENQRDFKQSWESLSESREQYVLCWESKYLVQLGEALSYIFNSAMTMAAKEALKFTVLRGLLAAVTWPATLLSVAGIIDNPWSVAIQRAQAAGRMLAEVLLAREQGNRPVTLIGFSLGARVIFSCLEELSKRKGSEGIVEDAILLGAPAPGDPKVWAKFAHVVAGRVVNGYCRGDWLLKFLYRTSSVQFRIAGLCSVKWEDRRMFNIDLSEVVSGHFDYKQKLETIMRVVGVRTREELSHASSSSLTSFPGASGGVGSLNMDDLSSSDDDMYTEVNPGAEVCHSGFTCIPNHKEKQLKLSPIFTGDVTSRETFPKSVSSDSGISSMTKSETGEVHSDNIIESSDCTAHRSPQVTLRK